MNLLLQISIWWRYYLKWCWSLWHWEEPTPILDIIYTQFRTPSYNPSMYVYFSKITPLMFKIHTSRKFWWTCGVETRREDTFESVLVIIFVDMCSCTLMRISFSRSLMQEKKSKRSLFDICIHYYSVIAVYGLWVSKLMDAHDAHLWRNSNSSLDILVVYRVHAWLRPRRDTIRDLSHAHQAESNGLAARPLRIWSPHPEPSRISWASFSRKQRI